MTRKVSNAPVRILSGKAQTLVNNNSAMERTSEVAARIRTSCHSDHCARWPTRAIVTQKNMNERAISIKRPRKRMSAMSIACPIV